MVSGVPVFTFAPCCSEGFLRMSEPGTPTNTEFQRGSGFDLIASFRGDTEATVKSTRTQRTIVHVTLSWLRYPELSETPAQARAIPRAECQRQGVLGKSTQGPLPGPLQSLAGPANARHLIWSRRSGSPCAASECPAGMAEHRGDRPCVARSVGQMAPMRAPCACGISKTKTHNEDRRLDENGEHRIRPVVAPRSIFTADL